MTAGSARRQLIRSRMGGWWRQEGDQKDLPPAPEYAEAAYRKPDQTFSFPNRQCRPMASRRVVLQSDPTLTPDTVNAAC